ncbi:shikimate kinase [Brachybacterium rhamnosum]|uniref:Shikimate kinase n=1 Tax=Brachybacterium rhamnosum TaxID=173361 RepID=A0ABW4Q000_9MICO
MSDGPVTGPLVILMGPMAAGKTSVGRSLAGRLGVPFADLDELIVAAAGRGIPEIFEDRGEEGFRALEAEVLARALEERPGVLALGGGAPLRPESGERLRGRPVVLLEIDEQAAARRLGRGAGRPMLAGDDPLERWRRLMEERGPVYRDLAAHRVDAGRGSPGHVARTIISTLGLSAPGAEEENA